MEKKLSKRKRLRRKFKRYAAAVAGAAILTGAAASVPGIPVAKALAAEKPSTPPIKVEHRLKGGWHEHRHSWPSPDENQALYKDGRIYYRSNHYDDDHYRYVHYRSSPVEFVKDIASLYGFNRDNDSFTLLSQSANRASVWVVKQDTGQRFVIKLERNYDRDWEIVQVREVL